MKWKRALWLAVPWIACSPLPFLIWLGVIIISWLQRPTQAIDTQSIDYSESLNQWTRIVRDFGVMWLCLLLPGPAVGAGLLAWERALAAHFGSMERRIWSAFSLALSLVVGLIWSTLAAALVWSALAWFALATGHEDWVAGFFYGVVFYMRGWLWIPALAVVSGAIGGWETWRGARAMRPNGSR